MPLHCHKMVKNVAMEMAGEVYEELAKHNNWFYAENPSQDEFVRLNWTIFLDTARTTLAKLLTSNLNEDLKNQISDALIKDNSIRYGRTPTPQWRM